MSDPELAAAVDANYWESFRFTAEACGGKTLVREDAIAVATRAPVAALNIGFITRPPDDPAKTLAAVVDFFDGLKLPFVVRIREGIDPRTEQSASAMGLAFTDAIPGMALYPIPDRAPSVPGLRIAAVSNPAELEPFHKVVAERFGMPLRMVESFLVPELIALQGVEMYTGFVTGEPVATSMLIVTDETAGVFNVATLPEYRGRGIGEAMTSQAAARGLARGCAMAALQASAMGRPVYERMGFRTVAPYLTFTRPDQLNH